MIKKGFILLLWVTLMNTLFAQSAQIVISQQADEKEDYASRELQRYIYQLSGDVLPIVPDNAPIQTATFLIGRAGSHRAIDRLIQSGELTVSSEAPGPEGYVLKKTTYAGHPALVVAGSDAVGVLYGVYGLLNDHYGVSFTLTGEALPGRKKPFFMPDVDERKSPAVGIRGVLPWTNFPQSATVYSWPDWRFIIDQMARMRMNFLHIHNYNGMLTHNEMYHNFELDGFMSRVWMPTARTGHAWAGPAWDVNRYRFGAADLFDDYDFGADCALYNDNLSNREVFSKGISMFQKVIDYAHTRGVKIGLGLDIDLIPEEYNVKASDPNVVAARVEQLTRDYPKLDYLICFQSEVGGHDGDKQDFFERWRDIFMGFYEGYKERGLTTRLAVAGWGLDPASIATLPPDVIAAPISAYSAGFESGAIYGDREYWGCPWLERDFASSQYYYPYTMHLADTIQSYQQRAENMTGLYTLTWRLGDAVEPRMVYIAKAPWDDRNKYDSAEAVYREYAQRHFGQTIADRIVEILNENEPFACDMGECAPTPAFTGATRYPKDTGYFFNLLMLKFYQDEQLVVTINAADYTQQQGVRKAPSGKNGDCVGYIKAGDWIHYVAVDFGTGVNRLVVRAASDTDGGDMDLRLGGHSGRTLVECAIPGTGGWQQWRDFEFSIAPVSGKQDLYLMFLNPEVNHLPKAIEQVELLDSFIAAADDPGNRRRLDELRCRIAAARDFIELQHTFMDLEWSQLPGAFPSWVRHFTHRVNDISSLGNVQSTQNRFIQLRYLQRKQYLRNQLPVMPPANVTARGTRDGAVISWTNKQDSVSGFIVYRDGKRLNKQPLLPHVQSFVDKGDGVFTYVVTTIDNENRQSVPSVPAICAAGSADTEPPHIVVISPPTSVESGRPIDVKARILDGRTYDHIAAELVYRPVGQTAWKTLPMQRRTKAVFDGRIPAQEVTDRLIEYYIRASDGSNSAVFPATAPTVNLTTVVYTVQSKTPRPPRNITADCRQLLWRAGDDTAHWYRIYRSKDADFEMSMATFLTYVGQDTTRFEDIGLDFDGRPLNGTWFYRITAVNRHGNESNPTGSIEILW